MGKLLSTNHLLHQHKTIKRNYRPIITVGPISLSFNTLFLFLILALFYFAFSTQITAKGYELEKIKSKKLEILDENEKLEVEAARLQALWKIEASAQELGMIKAQNKNIQYASSSNNVASR